MADFKSSFDYLQFASFVKEKARYVMDARSQAFLSAAVRTAEKRKKTLKRGTPLWRAQAGHEMAPTDIPEPEPLKASRMKPLADRAYEGRVNPKGIPCLYLSNDMKTAMKEVRPWIGSFVSVAKFVMLRDLILVDCSSDTRVPDFSLGGDEVDPAILEQGVWRSINEAFSEPVTRTDDVAAYAPT